MGSVPTSSPGGPEVVANCMQALKEQDTKETPEVKLSMAANGMIITKHNPKDQNDIEVCR